MFKTAAALTAVLFVCCASAPVTDNVLITEIAAPRVAEIVAMEGFAVVDTHTVDRKTLIHVKINGTNVLLVVGETGGNLQAFTAFSDTAADLKRINQWNKSKRFSRAYLDDDGDPVLESDLDLAGGATERGIAKFLKTYLVSLAVFEQEVCLPQVAPTQDGQPVACVVQGQ